MCDYTFMATKYSAKKIEAFRLIMNQDSIDLLLGRTPKSYTNASDILVECGIWDDDGSLTDEGASVKAQFEEHERLNRLAEESR